MTNEENLIFLKSQITCAIIELEAMKAENKQREIEGKSLAYDEESFLSLINKYGLGHNTIINSIYS